MKELDMYFSFIKNVKGLSDRTVACYKNWLGEFFDVMDIKTIDDIKAFTICDIDIYIKRLGDKGNNPNTKNIKLNAVRSLFTYLRKRGILEKNITDDIEWCKVPYREKNIPTQEEICKILAKLRNSPNQKLYTILLLLAETGMRFSEMADLKLKDVEFIGDDHFIRIIGKGNKERKVYVSDDLKAQLKYYIFYCRELPDVLTEEEFKAKQGILAYAQFGTYENYLDKREMYKDNLFTSKFGTRIDNKNLNGSLQKVAKEMGVNVQIKDVTLHSLRHFFATYALDNGMRIDVLAQMLGHSSIATTQKYIHRSDEVIIEENKKAFNFNNLMK